MSRRSIHPSSIQAPRRCSTPTIPKAAPHSPYKNRELFYGSITPKHLPQRSLNCFKQVCAIIATFERVTTPNIYNIVARILPNG